MVKTPNSHYLLLSSLQSNPTPCHDFSQLLSLTIPTSSNPNSFAIAVEIINGLTSKVFSVSRDSVCVLAAKALPVLGAATFGYSTFLSWRKEKQEPLNAAFSVAVYSTLVLSTGAITYAYSSCDEKKKERAMWVVVFLFVLVIIAFLARVSVIIPPESIWTIFASSLVPLFAGLALLFIRRSIVGVSSSKHNSSG